MRLFGTLRTASILAVLFLSLVECVPSKALDKDYLEDGEYDEDSTLGNDDDDPSQPADSGPTRPIHVRSRNTTIVARPGDTVEFPCLADNAEDTVISWYRDNELLFLSERPMISDENSRFTRADNFSLILRNVVENDASYTYRCQFLVKPSIEIIHKLDIIDQPRELSNVIRVKPGSQVEINENESITFGCETSIEPKPPMIWSHKGERLHNGEVIEAGGNFITIKKATRRHAGRYQCLADDGSNKPPHDSIHVIVKYKPVVEVEHEVVHTGTGINSELTCIVHAHPYAKVTWHKNQKQITEKPGRKSFVENENRRTLVIEHTTQHDFGQYYCVAKNQLGEASGMIELTGTPSRPRFHGGEFAEDESTFILKWHVESYAPITEYKLEYRREGEKTWKTLSPRVTNGRGANQFTAEHALERLQPGLYEARLMAKNEYGWSQHSNLHTFTEEYRSETAQKVTDAAMTTRPLLALTVLLALLASSYESNYL